MTDQHRVAAVRCSSTAKMAWTGFCLMTGGMLARWQAQTRRFLSKSIEFTTAGMLKGFTPGAV